MSWVFRFQTLSRHKPEENDSELTWHSSSSAGWRKQPMLGNIDLYLQQVKPPHPRFMPTVLAGIPQKPVLALGWENGEVVLYHTPSGDQTVLPAYGLHHAAEWATQQPLGNWGSGECCQ
ncbi:intraflagellar transport protein 140 homolog [Lates japonicus]|uniref:Intraflagellar transport protein 140 homolog n=1 Tax=Lates japonicus TaxID=270547 RepID=A0AAD3MQB1_LATJO|nr:intraflagellar transport protein 140 homolog [Lates japonicus]